MPRPATEAPDPDQDPDAARAAAEISAAQRAVEEAHAEYQRRLAERRRLIQKNADTIRRAGWRKFARWVGIASERTLRVEARSD
jgi:hypothetical protein